MSHTPVTNVDPGDFGKASWADLVRAADLDLTERVEDLEAVAGSGSVTGPGTSTDNAIPRFDGAGGGTLQNSGITIADGASGTLAGSNSGDVTLAGTPTYLTLVGQVLTRVLINLASHVTGRLPFANLTAATAATRLLGRGGGAGAGDLEEILLGSGLEMSGNTISATGGGSGGAPTNASYLTLATDGNLDNERVLTAGTGISFIDNGAGGTLEVHATPITGAQNTYLVTGGQIVWQSAYTFDVSAASYFITGAFYTSAADTVTLTAAHATLDRIDVIAVDDAGTVVVIDGTAAAQPSEPDVDPGTQLKLGFVFVAAASSAPSGVTDTPLYLENAGDPAEWDWTTSGSGFTLNSTNNPRTGTTDIEGTAVANGAYAQGEIGTGTIEPNDYSLIAIYIRSKATWSNNRGLAVSLRLNGAQVGGTVTIQRSGTWGFSSSNTTDYQLVAIPITAFAIASGLTINQIRITDFGGSIGFYLDDIALQGGSNTPQPVAGITQEQADARYLLRPGTVTDNAIVRYNGTTGAAVQNSAPIVQDDGRISTVTDPSSAQDAATKAYVDALAVNLGKRARVRAATTANVTIATALNNADTLDGVTLAAGDLVLVKDQTAPAENGVYTVGVSPVRASEFDAYDEHPGSLIAVQEGTSNGDTLWLCTSNVGGTLNTTAIAFSQLSVSAGAPTTASYVTLGTDGTLSNERVLTGTSNQITVTDGGAGAAVTLSTPQDLHTGATPQFARMGLAVAADASAKLKIAGQYGSTLYDAGNSSTAITLDWDNGNTQLVTLTGNATFTLSNPKDGFRYLIVLKQDGTGSRTVTWPSSVKWQAGTAPTLSTTAGKVDIVTLVWVAGIGASGNYLAAANTDYTPA